MEINDIEVEVFVFNLFYCYEVKVCVWCKVCVEDFKCIDVLFGVVILEVCILYYVGLYFFCFEDCIINIVVVFMVEEVDFEVMLLGCWLIW